MARFGAAAPITRGWPRPRLSAPHPPSPPAGSISTIIPTLTPLHPVGPVVGDVFEVAPDLLKRLDDFEGVPILYQRRRLVVTVDGIGELETWAYVRSDRIGTLLDRGDYMAVSSQKSPE